MHRSTDALVCPVCDEPLTEDGGSLRCARRHTFNRAREGYIDLLASGHGRTNIHGDTKAMVRARRRFLSGGSYQPLTDAIVRLTTEHFDSTHTRENGEPWLCILDVGCGEGTYGCHLMASLAPGRGRCLYGLDISRDALRLAARACPDGTFFLNDVAKRICLADATIDVLLDIFAPRNASEFARVVRPGGLLQTVIPTEPHLQELRTALPLLGIAPEKRERTIGQLTTDFALSNEEVIEYTMTLSPDDVLDLVLMTPSAHHLQEAQIGGLAAMSVTAGFRILSFVKRDS